MFASENILLNSTICCLEHNQVNQVNAKGCRWATRDIVFTDRALYIFAEVQAQDSDQHRKTCNYLLDRYERLDVKMFKARNTSGEIKPPEYMDDIPDFVGSFSVVIELFNKNIRKRRLVACTDKIQAQEFTSVFNLISCYRAYEMNFEENDDGLPFID